MTDILERLDNFRIGTSIDLLIADARDEIKRLREQSYCTVCGAILNEGELERLRGALQGAEDEIEWLRTRLITADTVPQRAIPGTNIPDAETPSY
jgi:hypothetical protein